MQLFLDGKAVSPDDVTVSKDGFGDIRHQLMVAYRFGVPRADFEARFSSAYEECIKELRRDDKIIGKFTPPYPGAKDYPTLHELLDLRPKDLFEFVDTYFAYDILSLYFTEDGVRQEWVLRSVDSISVEGDLVWVAGKANAMPKLV